jgi:hypothetical protein
VRNHVYGPGLQFVEEALRQLSVLCDVGLGRRRRFAPAVAGEIECNYAVTGGDARDHLSPQVGGGREAVQEHDWIPSSTGPGSVVVQADAAYIYELTSQCRVRLL